MNKTVKRIITATMAVLVCAVPLISSAALRQVPQEESMESALRSVKSLINVDDSVYTDFNYSSSYTNYETREGLVWSFNWSAPEDGYISAAATDDGTLLSYSKYAYERESFGFAEISKTEALETASEFLKRANPETFSFYPAPTETSIDINNAAYHIEYSAQIDGYNFNDARISIQIDKFSGEITSYYTTNTNPSRYTPDSQNSLIASEKAIEAYAEKIGLRLEYMMHSDYKSGNLKIFPVYLFNSGSDRFISAVTGEIVEYVYDRTIDEKNAERGFTSAEAAMDLGGANARLTPAEIAAIDQVKGFITDEQALANLLKTANLSDLNTESMTDFSITLNRDYIETDRYFYNIYMSKYNENMRSDEVNRLSGKVDASTGRVLAFSYNYSDLSTAQDGSTVITYEDAKAVALRFLEANAAGELSKSKLDESNPQSASPYDYGYRNYEFQYIRHENNTPFRSNGIRVSINPATGKIVSYSLDWYTTITFPSVNGIMSAKDALSAFVDQNSFELKHITVGDAALNLVYDFVKPGYIDPKTGKSLSYDGTLLPNAEEKPDYGDVSGHWSESYVIKLLDNGVYLWGGRFEPNKQMTQQEFLEYISQTNRNPRIYPANTFIDVRPEQPENIRINASEPATRQEAARILAEYLGYGKLASQPQWFNYPFSDEVGADYKGYITVCTALGIFEQASAFNASESVTRGQAAKILCNLIENAV